MRVRAYATFLMFLTASLYAQTPTQMPAGSFPAAIAAHGGAAVDSVVALRLDGQSTGVNGNVPVTITAQLDGHIRFDYGQPVQWSLIHTPSGEVIQRGTKIEPKQPHVELFATLDLLSIFGLRRLETGAPTWANAGTAVDNGRAVIVSSVSTGQSEKHYGRLLKDEFQVAFDAQTSLVSSVTRQQYSDNSLDLVFPVTYRFSDYRQVGQVVFPYRLEKSVSGRVTETITLTSVELNPPVSSSTFAR
jgi:hypothetical protein